MSHVSWEFHKTCSAVLESFSRRQSTAQSFLGIIRLENKEDTEFYGFVSKFHVDYKIRLIAAEVLL